MSISSRGSDDAAITNTGFMVGTPTYASPEQASGERQVDGRSDIYSLGCVLYEMLAGEPPFSGPNARAVVARHLASPVTSVRVLRPAVSEALSLAISRALAKAPADRFATAAEFGVAVAAPEGESVAGRRSVAVLPFANLSSDPESEYFSDGMTEEIITSLSRISALHVAARTSSFAFKGKTQDIRRIGEQLGVSTVLEGSVRRAGGRLRVTAQLIGTTDGYHLWTERFDRQIEDVFAIQDEIAERIATALQVILSPDQGAPGRGATANLDAYDLYLRGRQHFHQFRRRSFDSARDLFHQAVQMDPSYARAWAGIAETSASLYTIFDASDANMREADESSRRAVELDPDLAEAHAARGYALTIAKRFDEAWPEFTIATRLNPNLFEAWYFQARARWLAGDLSGAAACFERASEVRPEDFQTLALGATAWEGMGRSVEAARAHRLALERIDRHLQLYPNDVRAIYMGGISWTRLGDSVRGLQWVERALALDPDDPATMYNIACAFAVLGDADRSLDCLERCYRMGLSHRDWIAHDPDLISLRDLPRFKALLGVEPA